MQRKVSLVGDAEKYPNEWARLVAETRKRLGWSQEEMADRLGGLNRATVGRWETGLVTNPTLPLMRLFAAATGVDYREVATAVLGAQQRRHDDDDVAIREVAESSIPEHSKQEIIEYLLSKRTESEMSLRRDVEMLIRAHQQRPPTEPDEDEAAS